MMIACRCAVSELAFGHLFYAPRCRRHITAEFSEAEAQRYAATINFATALFNDALKARQNGWLNGRGDY